MFARSRASSNRAAALPHCHGPLLRLPRQACTGAARALRTTDVTKADDRRFTDDLVQRFKAADLDGNGYLDREEFARLAESFTTGTEYSLFHWLNEDVIDELFAKYASPDAGVITLTAFKTLASDGVLLEGRLSEYRDLFERAASYESEDEDSLGTVSADAIVALAARLEQPLSQQQTLDSLQRFFGGDAGVSTRVSFAQFLNMFRDHMLDLQQISEYMKLPPEPMAPSSLEELERAKALVPPPENGVHSIASGEECGAMQLLHPDKVVLLMAGLSWCRPCKGLGRPLQKLAEHYADGLVILKMLGDKNDNTKRYFKNVLRVKATPQLTIFRNGTLAYQRTGANKWKLENAIRRFYNLDKHPLPSEVVYPPQGLK